jgi:hypothetical protein
MKNEENEKLIEQIVDIEWKMFSEVNASENAECQKQEETFRLMRWMSHSEDSQELLESYLNDLNQALENGRNLMTEKYAIIQGFLSPEVNTQLIDQIAGIESQWMKSLSEKYPTIIKGDGESFSKYLKGELHTYSYETVSRYYDLVSESKRNNINLAEKRYTNLFSKLGYNSLEEKEAAEREKLNLS